MLPLRSQACAPALIDKEEILGYVLADALGRPLLTPEDARKIGKRAASQLTVIGKKLKAATKEAGEAARKAQDCAEVDTAKLRTEYEKEAHDELLDMPYDLKIPARTVGAKRKRADSSAAGAAAGAAAAAEEEHAALPTRAEAEAAERKAQAALDAAKAVEAAHEHSYERVQRRCNAIPRPGDKESNAILDQMELEGWDLSDPAFGPESDARFQRLYEPLDAANAAVDAAREELSAAKMAVIDAWEAHATALVGVMMALGDEACSVPIDEYERVCDENAQLRGELATLRAELAEMRG